MMSFSTVRIHTKRFVCLRYIRIFVCTVFKTVGRYKMCVMVWYSVSVVSPPPPPPPTTPSPCKGNGIVRKGEGGGYPISPYRPPILYSPLSPSVSAVVSLGPVGRQYDGVPPPPAPPPPSHSPPAGRPTSEQAARQQDQYQRTRHSTRTKYLRSIQQNH